MMRWAMAAVRKMTAGYERHSLCCVRLFMAERVFAAQQVQRRFSAWAVVPVAGHHPGVVRPKWCRSRAQCVEWATRRGSMGLPQVLGEKREAAK